MTQFNLGYRIEAKDATRSTLASALSGVTRFARIASKPITIPLRVGRKSLSLLRDVNLGLRPLVGAIDNVIDRGARLEVVSKSFQSLTGKNAAQARRLAKELVVAASGTIKLSKAMEIANRALGSGIDLSQLTTAIEFISKKAITTGKNAETSLEKVITGLSRGSTLFLDDFGILVDGIDGVRRSFDKVKGAGAFDSLGPAAQKAEIIRQAIAEMGVQMGKIGVTGKETIFLFQGIKNQIGDSVDKLVGAIAGSKALNSALQGIRDTISGITNFLEGGGSIVDVLFGKKGGKSGGIFGLLKAGLLDAAEGFGKAMLVGVLKAIIALRDLFKDVKVADFVPDIVKSAADAAKNVVLKVSKFVASGGGLFPKPTVTRTVAGQVATRGARFAVRGATARAAARAAERGESAFFAAGKSAVESGASTEAAKKAALAAEAKALGKAGTGVLRGVATVGKFAIEKAFIAFTVADFVDSTVNLFSELRKTTKLFDDIDREQQELQEFARKRLKKSRKDKAKREAAARRASSKVPDTIGGSLAVVLSKALPILALGAAENDRNDTQKKQQSKGVGGSGNVITDFLTGSSDRKFDILQRLVDILQDGTSGSGRFSRQFANFKKDFPGSKPRAKPFSLGIKPLAPVGVDTSLSKLSDKGFIDRVGEFNLLRREIRKIEGQTKRDARREAAQEIRRRVLAGEDFNAEDRRRIQKETFDRLLKERTISQRKRSNEIGQEIGADFKRRGQEGRLAERQKLERDNPLIKPINDLIKNNQDTIDRIEQTIGDMIGTIKAGIAAIAGDERNIANAGGRRT